MISRFSHLMSQSAVADYQILQYSIPEYFTYYQDFQINNIIDL